MSTTNNSPLTVPDVPVVESDLILTPAEIVTQFRSATNSFECYRVLQEVFLNYVQSRDFNNISEKTRIHHCICMQIIGEAIFNLERHAQAWDIGTMIMKYMETVYKVDDAGMARVVASIREIESKYGNLRHGLESLLEHKDSTDRMQASTDGWPFGRRTTRQHNGGKAGEDTE